VLRAIAGSAICRASSRFPGQPEDFANFRMDKRSISTLVMVEKGSIIVMYPRRLAVGVAECR